MPSTLLENRYEFTPDGKAIVDITVESISDLFNSFDKKAVFSRRELDQDFVDYLFDCVREIGSDDFVVRVSIEHEFNSLQENNLRKAIINYFAYVSEIEKIKFRKEMGKFFLLMLFGITLLALLSKYKIPDSAEVEVWVKTAQEGLIIASWVAIWEAMTAIFFCWSPYFAKTEVYNRILTSEIKIINVVSRLTI
ncbi:MAG: hypothetical protein ACOYXC_02145 [Candidatus Rifleibacteriota bacterium]